MPKTFLPRPLGLGVLAPALALAVLSCAGILQIDDRSRDPELDDAGNPIVTGPDGAPLTDQYVPPGDDAGPVVGPDGAIVPGQDGGDATVPPGRDGGPPVSHCATGTCQIASGLNHPFLMATDANYVYWTEFGDDQGSSNGVVRGCSLSGCTAGSTTYGIGLVNPRGIAVDAQNVYFGTASYGPVVGGIYVCAIGGCGNAPTRLSAAGIPYGVAVDATSVYWVDSDDGSIHKIAKTGAGGDVVLCTGAKDPAIEPGNLVVDGGFLYFGDINAGAYSLPVTGGIPTYLGTSTYGGNYGITTDDASVYFGGSGKILRATKNVKDSGTPLATPVTDPTGLAFDRTSGKIYYSNWGNGSANDGTIGKVNADGITSAAVIAASLVTPEAISLTGSEVVWLSNGALGDAGGAIPSTGAVYITAK